MQPYRSLRLALPVALAMTVPIYAQRNPQLREGMYETRDHKRNCLVMRDDDSHDKYEICDDASRSPSLHTTFVNGRLSSFRYGNKPTTLVATSEHAKKLSSDYESFVTPDSREAKEVNVRRNATVEAVRNHITLGIGHFR